MIITKTPFRLSLFGGGTDYPAWYEKHPSKMISAAMANYCFLTVKKLEPFHEYKNRIVYSKMENVNSFDEIDHPSVKACLQYLQIENGISITHDGDLPARSGIGSSSAFTVGLLNALYRLKGDYISQINLAKDAIHVEQNIIGENVGIQDQIMAAHGSIRVIEMNKDGWSSKELELSPKYFRDLQSHIMLGFSGVSRHAEEQSKKKVENIKSGISTELLLKTSELANEAINCFINEEDMYTIGNLFHIGWSLKRKLTDTVTNNYLDDVYMHAMKSGAFGGKLMGAGGGGFFLFIVPPDKQDLFKQEMKEIKVWVPFNFDMLGSQVIFKS